MSDLQTLMDTDPLELTKADRAEIIAYFRDNRERFIAAGGKAPAKATKTPKGKSVPDIDISLEDLGL